MRLFRHERVALTDRVALTGTIHASGPRRSDRLRRRAEGPSEGASRAGSASGFGSVGELTPDPAREQGKRKGLEDKHESASLRGARADASMGGRLGSRTRARVSLGAFSASRPVALGHRLARGSLMMKSARRTLGLLAVALLGATWLASAAQAKTIKVDANGTTEAIQSAINAAGAYDTVAVPAGTYACRKEQPHQRRAGHRAGEHGQLRRASQHADQQHDRHFRDRPAEPAQSHHGESADRGKQCAQQQPPQPVPAGLPGA